MSAHTHKTASLRLAGLFTILIRKSKNFCQPGRPKLRGDGSVSGAPWSRYPAWPSCHPSTTSTGTKHLTGSQLHLLTSSQPLLFLYFSYTFPQWFFSQFCEVLTILVSITLSLPVILPLFLFFFFTGCLTAFSCSLTIFSDIWAQVTELGCIWARPWIPGRLTAEWGSSERSSRADTSREGYSV